MFASGTSQLAFLNELMTRPGVDWARVTGFHMDEYVGISGDDPSSFARYMRERIVARAHPAEFHYLDGLARSGGGVHAVRRASRRRTHSTSAVSASARTAISRSTIRPSRTSPTRDRVKVVALDDACKRQQVGEGHFPDRRCGAAHAITVTIPALLAAGRVLAIVPESRKAIAGSRRARGSGHAPSCPASILQQTAHTVVYLDRDSASLLTLDR